ncbi:MAG: carboxypeptidase-like regulatory domain-containing protein [Bacteroidales bacterium]
MQPAGLGLRAQDLQITGTVVSADDGSALPGVTVVVKGTTVGAVTDFEGKYTIVAPAGSETLVFSFVGMQTTEIAIGNSTVIDLSMEVDAVRMDELSGHRLQARPPGNLPPVLFQS